MIEWQYAYQVKLIGVRHTLFRQSECRFENRRWLSAVVLLEKSASSMRVGAGVGKCSLAKTSSSLPEQFRDHDDDEDDQKRADRSGSTSNPSRRRTIRAYLASGITSDNVAWKKRAYLAAEQFGAHHSQLRVLVMSRTKSERVAWSGSCRPPGKLRSGCPPVPFLEMEMI